MANFLLISEKLNQLKNFMKRTKKESKSVKEEKTQQEDQINDTINENAEILNEENTNNADCCKEQIDALNDKYIRLLAEFENFKKRTIKEKEELIKYGSSKILSSLLPIFDDIERAVNTNGNLEDKELIIEGIELIYKKFQSILKQSGIEEIESVGKDFDTDYHEALSIVEVGKEQQGKVIQEVEKGFVLNGKVIRFSKVIVGK